MLKNFNTKIFFYIALASMPLYLVRFSVFALPTNVFEAFILISLLAWALTSKRQDFSHVLIITKPFLFGVVLLLFGVLSSLAANGFSFAGLGILKSWFVLPLAFSIALASMLKSESDIKKVFYAIYFSAVTVATAGIFYMLSNNLTYDGRLKAFYLSPNHLAMYLAPGIIIGFYFLSDSFFRRFNQWKVSANLLAVVILLLSLYYTYSYAAWIAVGLSLVLASIMLSDSFKKRLLLGLGAFSCFIILFFSQSGTAKFSTLATLSDRSSLASRIMIWKSSVEMLRQHPIFGIGPGNFQTAYLNLQPLFPPYLEWAVPEPHNIFLAFWLQAGILGLLGFIYILCYVFSVLRNLLRNKKTRFLATFLFSFFIYTLLHGLADTPYWKNDLSAIFWTFVCLALALNKIRSESATD